MSGEKWGRAFLSMGLGISTLMWVGMTSLGPWWASIAVGAAVTLLAYYWFQPAGPLRAPGDWGTHEEALDWAFDFIGDEHDFYLFLQSWREGDLAEWPDYLKWLDHGRCGRLA